MVPQQAPAGRDFDLPVECLAGRVGRLDASLSIEHKLEDTIWVALRDSRDLAREDAVAVVRTLLADISRRNNPTRWYHLFIDEALTGLRSTSEAAVQGSMGTLSELFADWHGGLEDARLMQIFDTVWSHRDSRNRHVRTAVIEFLPRLASVGPEAVAAEWLQQSVSHLLASLQLGSDVRTAACRALGQMALVASNAFIDFVPMVLRECCGALTAAAIGKARTLGRGAAFGPDAPLECIGLLAKAYGSEIEVHMAGILPYIFCEGLTPSLATLLPTLAAHVPSLVPQLQDRLLDAVCMVLTRSSFAMWCSAFDENDDTRALRHLHSLEGRHSGPSTSLEQVALALQMLGSFDMKGCELISFMHKCIAPYLESQHASIRTVAATTCIHLLTADPAVRDEKSASPSVLAYQEHNCSNCREDDPSRFGCGQHSAEAVLKRVIVVGVADRDSAVRYAVLSTLTPAFDAQLAFTGRWELVLMALCDESLRVRDAAVRVLGRITKLNPAIVTPALRTLLFDLLTEIHHSSSLCRKDEAAHLLGRLVCASPQLIRPYATTVLQVLLPQLRDSACALASLGELAVVAGQAVGPSMPRLLPQLLPVLQDHASSYKRRTALHALSQLLRATGYPSEHSHDGAPSPSALMLSTLLAMLGSEQEGSTRLELLRSLGTLGAPDPSTQMQIQLARQRTASTNVRCERADPAEERPAGDLDDDSIEPSHPEFYPSAALRALTRIL